MSFFNPYMKNPDFGQGVGDIAQQIMQIMLMQKMFPGQQQPTTPGGLPQSNIGGAGIPPAPGQMPGQPFSPPTSSLGQTPAGQGIDPQILMMILKLIMGGGQGGGIGMGGRGSIGGGLGGGGAAGLSL